MWLHIGLVDRVRPIAAFDSHLGLAQTSLDIPPLQRRCRADIRRKPVSLDRYGLRNAGVSFSSSSFERTARAGRRGIWLRGGFGIDDSRQRIVLDLHGVGSILGAR